MILDRYDFTQEGINIFISMFDCIISDFADLRYFLQVDLLEVQQLGSYVNGTSCYCFRVPSFNDS